MFCACSKKDKSKSDSGPASTPESDIDPEVTGEDEANTATTLKFLTPSDKSQRVVQGASYDIAIEFINAAATASWSQGRVVFAQRKLAGPTVPSVAGAHARARARIRCPSASTSDFDQLALLCL